MRGRRGTGFCLIGYTVTRMVGFKRGFYYDDSGERLMQRASTTLETAKTSRKIEIGVQS